MLLLCSNVLAEVQVTIKSGASGALAESIKRNASNFLSELDDAYAKKRELDFTSVETGDYFKDDMRAHWQNEYFRSVKNRLVVYVVAFEQTYYIRGIEVQVSSCDGSALSSDASRKVLNLCFSSDGKLKDYTFMDKAQLTERFYSDKLSDRAQWLEIANFVEHYRTAYNKKDIGFIENVFSNDALIITGKVIKRAEGLEVQPNVDEVVYTQQTKTQYITNLKKVFQSNRYINVRFDDVAIYKHPNASKYPDVYGVLVTQTWESSNYSDIGYVFMLWDFSGIDPVIRVRTWQPKFVDEDRTRTLDEADIFDPSFFDLGK